MKRPFSEARHVLFPRPVIPAKAGIQWANVWTPAFAGVTTGRHAVAVGSDAPFSHKAEGKRRRFDSFLTESRYGSF
jgi:hypothetical protein